MKKDSINRIIGGIDDYVVETAESRLNVRIKKVSWVKWGFVAAALVLVLSAVFIVPGMISRNPAVEPIAASDNTPQVSEENSNQKQNNSSETTNGNTAETAGININKLSGAPGAATMDIGLFLEDKITKTPEELREYYGTDIYPSVLPDSFIKEMFADLSSEFAIYQSEDHGIYYDQNTFVYVSEEAMPEYERIGYLDWTAPTIEVTVSKARGIIWDIAIGELAEAPLQTSIINGYELTVCKYVLGNGDHYVAYFTKDNVNFEIDGNMISEKEFTALLTGYFTE